MESTHKLVISTQYYSLKTSRIRNFYRVWCRKQERFLILKFPSDSSNMTSNSDSVVINQKHFTAQKLKFWQQQDSAYTTLTWFLQRLPNDPKLFSLNPFSKRSQRNHLHSCLPCFLLSVIISQDIFSDHKDPLKLRYQIQLENNHKSCRFTLKSLKRNQQKKPKNSSFTSCPWFIFTNHN